MIAVSSPADDGRPSKPRPRKTPENLLDQLHDLGTRLDGRITLSARAVGSEIKIALIDGDTGNECRFSVGKSTSWPTVEARVISSSGDLLLEGYDGRKRSRR